MKVRPDDLRAFLQSRETRFEESEVQYGRKFTGPDDEVFVAYDSGKLVVQGNDKTGLASAVRDWAGGEQTAFAPAPPAARTEANAAPVFIVYGHDLDARESLELVLLRMGLKPIVLANLAATGDTIIEKLEEYLGEQGAVGFACVLLTPDDEGYKVGEPEGKHYRARQNVVLELGMVLVRLGRRRVAILHKQSVELPSDINGLIYIPFQERVDEVRTQLYKALEAAGYHPRSDGL